MTHAEALRAAIEKLNLVKELSFEGLTDEAAKNINEVILDINKAVDALEALDKGLISIRADMEGQVKALRVEAEGLSRQQDELK